MNDRTTRRGASLAADVGDDKAETPTPSALEMAARANGATDPPPTEVDAQRIPLPMEVAAIPTMRVGDIFPSPDKWNMYTQVDLDDVVDRELVLVDVMFFDSLTFDNSEWMITLAMEREQNTMITFSGGGSVLLRKLHGLKESQKLDGTPGLFPINGRITRHESSTKGFHDYYDLI